MARMTEIQTRSEFEKNHKQLTQLVNMFNPLYDPEYVLGRPRYALDNDSTTGELTLWLYGLIDINSDKKSLISTAERLGFKIKIVTEHQTSGTVVKVTVATN